VVEQTLMNGSTEHREKRILDLISKIGTGMIEEISMVGWKLGDDQALKIAEGLCTELCKTRILRLGGNNIGPVGATALANSFLLNRSLTEVYLAGSILTTET
jgi:hypothetical protein